jgi:two-component system, OmpR family, sensor histidine kinase BaeS
MSLVARLVLTVALTALFSATLTGYLSYRAASERVPRAFGVTAARGAGPGGAGGAGAAVGGSGGGGAAHASELLLSELQRATIQAAGLALAVAVVGGGWIALRSSRPILRLAAVARRYADGERTLRADPAGPREVAGLGRVFNDLADRLRSEEEQRRRFTTDVAHELRTPLTVLKSELEAIEDGLMVADPDTVAQLLQQVDLLARLVQDLRLLTQAEAGELTLQREAVDVGALVTGASGAFRARAAEAEVRLAVDAPPVVALVDAERLQQLLNALLDNALRHAPAGSEVRTVVARRGAEVDIEVLDQGPGIPADQRAQVFQRLYRVDPARHRAAGDSGSGLGLAIVAAIAALHGGRVAALERAGGGARFRVSLPLAER